ncbi:MAG: hypothetical protein GF416_06240 [Candidatus Altiarchaeales archaeon]|nr:hypothetical protein [Candidatus Altiarchaeales archaeon]MBD3416715.1 hypothetical protein [Candidatus Altiarchaeales archaeon]
MGEMRVVDETRGTVISEEAELRSSFLGRFRGLMLSGRKDIILECRRESILDSTIHMMYMLYPIDVVWVNGQMEVVDLEKGVRPFNPLKPCTWRLHKPRSPARYVIELGKAGLEEDVKVGDMVSFSVDE